MAAFLVAAVPRRIRLFAAFPTACLAGSSGCYTLRAGIQQHASPCGRPVPAFSEWRAGLSHFHLTPVASLHDWSEGGIEPPTLGFQGRCSTK
jgi:hypothetical protein